MLFGVRASWTDIQQQAQTAKRPEKNIISCDEIITTTIIDSLDQRLQQTKLQIQLKGVN